VLQRFADANIAVVDVGLRRPTLDDVFLTLTGHGAEEAAGSAEESSNDSESEPHTTREREVVR
jgi:ABC-2 type transport system ATP-binding protein